MSVEEVIAPLPVQPYPTDTFTPAIGNPPIMGGGGGGGGGGGVLHISKLVLRLTFDCINNRVPNAWQEII